jgi:hypothetical protein
VWRDIHYDCGANIEITSSPLHLMHVRHLWWDVEEDYRLRTASPASERSRHVHVGLIASSSHANGTLNSVPLTHQAQV